MQARHLEQTDNPSTHDSQDRLPKPGRRPSYHSDWSDDEDGKDNQARAPIAKPVPQKPQPSTSSGTHANETLRKPNTYPKALTFGRGKMAPLANGFTMGWGHGCGCGLYINHPPQPGEPKVAMVSPGRIVTTNRVQTYGEMPAMVRPQHALANWTGEQSQIMIIADSNTIDITSEDSESTEDDLVY